jgi:hypothetical protein
MKMVRFAVLAVGLLAATSAFALEKGDGLYGIQITNGTADLYTPDFGGSGYISAYDHSEVGVGLQYWRLMSDDYAFTLQGGIGFFSETDKPGTAAPSGSPDFKYTQSSWNVRLGGDRVVKIGDRAVVYFGPGIQVWSGKAKFDDGTPGGEIETENVMRYGLSGRVGGLMMLSEQVGFNCGIGRYVAMASAEADGAEATWWPSGFEASGGLVFKF